MAHAHCYKHTLRIGNNIALPLQHWLYERASVLRLYVVSSTEDRDEQDACLSVGSDRKVKVKQSHYRPEQAQRVPES